MLIYVMWCAGVAAKAMAAYRMASKGLVRTLPLLWCYLVFSVIYSLALMVFRSRPAVYLQFYSAGLPMTLLVKCSAVSSIFWALTGNYPNFRAAGSALLGACSAIGVIAVWMVAFLAEPVHAASWVQWLWNAAILTKRYTAIALLAILLSIRLFLPKAPRVAIPRSAKQAASLMAFDAAVDLAAVWIARLYAFRSPNAAALILTSGGLVVGLAWLTLKPGKDHLAEVSEGPTGLLGGDFAAPAGLQLAAARVDAAAPDSE
jgi:hypothetical protein